MRSIDNDVWLGIKAPFELADFKKFIVVWNVVCVLQLDGLAIFSEDGVLNAPINPQKTSVLYPFAVVIIWNFRLKV
jgi:hypothetical protein